MLSQLDKLCRDTEDRFAQDTELAFLESYVQSFEARKQLYSKLRSSEEALIQRVYAEITKQSPDILKARGQDFSEKWQMDTLRVLRYMAHAVLMNDLETYQQRFLLWFQTIMKAFGTQQSCYATYDMMKRILQKALTAAEFELIAPVLDLTQKTLGEGGNP